MATQSSINTSNPIAVGSGGTGNATATAYAVLCGGTTTTAALQSVASVGTSGQVLTSNGAGALPTFQAAPAGLSWSGTSSTSVSAAVSNGYVLTAGTLATVTLPTTFAVGQQIAVQGQGAGGWTLAAGTATTIQYGTSATSSAGSLSSTNRYDNCFVIGIVANTTWAVITSVSSGLTVV